MTGTEAIAIMHRIGLSQAAFARLTGQHVNTISKWANGQSPPGGASVALLRLLKRRPELITVLEDINKELELS